MTCYKNKLIEMLEDKREEHTQKLEQEKRQNIESKDEKVRGYIQEVSL